MLKLTVADITRLMYRAIEQLQKRRATLHANVDKIPLDLKAVFPFRPTDVEGIHTRKADEGAGVWFRLKDGRAFTKYGQPAPHDPALYDTTDENGEKQDLPCGSGEP
jgi:hypothetical protein